MEKEKKKRRMDNRLIMDISMEQYGFLQKESAKLEISISNYVRRALGLPDVARGRRTDLNPVVVRKRVSLRVPE
jgi:hypothetical protein